MVVTKFSGEFSDKKIVLDLGTLGKINVFQSMPAGSYDITNCILFDHDRIIEMADFKMGSKFTYSKVVEILPAKISSEDFAHYLTLKLLQGGYNMAMYWDDELDSTTIEACDDYFLKIAPILNMLGITLNKPKKKSAKPRHKFLASLAKTPFTIDHAGSTATVYWVKRSQFVIKAGAKLLSKPPLTKAGIIGFAGKFGLRLRDEHIAQIKDNVTTEDIVLRSVNEVGTFLYFAGTNSWLQLKSPEGKTLDELTIVK